MDKNLELYYIALIPPEAIQDEVHEFQHIAAVKFETEVTIKSPAHITIVPPFSLHIDEVKPMINNINILLKRNYSPIEVSVTRFYHFDHRNIILEVHKGREIERLFNDLMLVTEGATHHHNNVAKFIPHITIANRDLSPEVFDKAYDYFNHISYGRDFICETIIVFHFKDGKWLAIKNFRL
ncbi:MAG: 2'-5' RNA ligase family protein [Burkholderiales bacterium]|nr:2'-5' RNA ligase family protein [Burkholderiales bacterium]